MRLTGDILDLMYMFTILPSTWQCAHRQILFNENYYLFQIATEHAMGDPSIGKHLGHICGEGFTKNCTNVKL